MPLVQHVYAYANPKGDQWSFMHALNSKSAACSET